jgi:hypothetical protein
LLFAPSVGTAAELIQPRPCVRFVAAAVLLAPSLSGVVAIRLLDGWLSKPLSNLEWVDCRVKCGRKPGEANT